MGEKKNDIDHRPTGTREIDVVSDDVEGYKNSYIFLHIHFSS